MFFADVIMAQNPIYEKTSFAILFGTNNQSLIGKDFNGNRISSSQIIGFQAGIRTMIPVGQNFYFQTGASFSTKGSKFSERLVSQTINLSYIKAPLNLVYKSKLSKGSIYLGFGH